MTQDATALADILDRLDASQKACFDAGQHVAAMDIQTARGLIAAAVPALRATSQTPDAVRASQFWEALKNQCAASPDKSKVKALVQVRCEDVVAAWNALSTPSASAGPKAEAVNEPVAWQYRERGSFWRHCDVVTNDPAIEFRGLYDHPQPTHSQLDAIEDEIEKWSKDTRPNYPATEVAESFVRILEAAQPQQADGRGAVIEALDDSQSLLAMIHQLNTNGSVSEHDWETEGLSDLITKQISENRAALQQSPATDNAPAVGAQERNTP